MSWDAVAAIAEAAGAIGVLISIIYLASQVKQNTEESRINRSQNLVMANADVNALIADSPELAKIMRVGMLDFDALAEDEKFRFSVLYFSFMTKNDFGFHQWQEGKLDARYWKRTEFELRTYLPLAGSLAWWQRDKSRFSEELVEYVDALIADSDPANEVPALGPKSHETAT
ncbi:MAG: hypothetical protein RIC85_01610 [Gammaproteobacteria bacterium]